MIVVKVGKRPFNKGKESIAESMAKHKKAFITTAMDIVVMDIVTGIAEGKAISGGPLPDLEESTIKRKGHAQPLVDQGYLSRTTTYDKINSWRHGYGRITIRPVGKTPRNKVGEFLQIEGVPFGPGRTRKKYFQFFGISRDASKQMNDLIDYIMSQFMGEL